jgi:hypothetical protein
MLESVFGSAAAEKVLLSMQDYEQGYGREPARAATSCPAECRDRQPATSRPPALPAATYPARAERQGIVSPLHAGSSVEEVAATVSEALAAAGITAVLSGVSPASHRGLAVVSHELEFSRATNRSRWSTL